MGTPAKNTRPYQDDLVISVKELKDTFLFGVDMTDDNGKPFPKSIFEFYIKSAQEWLQTEIPGLILCPKELTTTHDYKATDYVSYGFIKTLYYPLLSVEEVGIQFPLSTAVLKFDESWYRADSSPGHINLIPTNGSFSSIILSQGGNFLPMLNGNDYMPGSWVIRARYGFPKGQIPTNIKEIVGMKAAMGPLNIAGDLIAGAGIASSSIGLDGLSQSISTTASATNAGYGSRIIQYNKEIDLRLESLRRNLMGLNMSVS